jgi:hypothetical protein
LLGRYFDHRHSPSRQALHLKTGKLNKTVKRQSGDFQNRPKMTKNRLPTQKRALQIRGFEARDGFRGSVKTAFPWVIATHICRQGHDRSIAKTGPWSVHRQVISGRRHPSTSDPSYLPPTSDPSSGQCWGHCSSRQCWGHLWKPIGLRQRPALIVAALGGDFGRVRALIFGWIGPRFLGWFLVLFWTPIFMVLFRSAIAPEIACFIGFFGNWPPFLRILENRPPNAV